MKKQWSFVGAFILLFIGAVLSVLNVDPVPVNFYFATYEWPLIIVILGSILLGALIASLLSTMKIYQETKMRKDAEKTASTADEKENERVKELENRYETQIDQLKEELRQKNTKIQELNNSNNNTINSVQE